MQAYIVQGLMLLYMKAHQRSNGFTQSQINAYPIPTHAIGIVAELASSVAIDRYGRRLSIGFGLCFIQVVCSVVLLIPDMSLAGNLIAFYLSSTSYGINPLLYSWSSNIVALTADDAARSVILASMAAFDGLLWTFWGIVFYPADDAPYWRNGYIAMICICSVLSSWLFLVRWVSDVASKTKGLVYLTLRRWIATPQRSTLIIPSHLSRVQGRGGLTSRPKRNKHRENTTRCLSRHFLLLPLLGGRKLYGLLVHSNRARMKRRAIGVYLYLA